MRPSNPRAAWPERNLRRITVPPDGGTRHLSALTNFQRQILISPVIPAGGGPAIATLRQVTITIQYTTPQLNVPKQYVLNTFISPYR